MSIIPEEKKESRNNLNSFLFQNEGVLYMSKYLVLSDLDDTLLTSEKTIQRQTKDFLELFVKRGNIFSICTGRPYSGCIHFYNEIGLKNMPMVTDNGCAIYNLDGKNKFFEIPLDIFKAFLEETKGMDAYMYTTTGYDISYAHNLRFVPRWIIHDENPGLKIIEGEPSKVTKLPPLICNYWVKAECIDAFLKIIDKYKDEIFYMNWGRYFQEDLNDDIYSIEIHSSHASKGHALRYLKEYYHIDDNKTLAFGDQLNDISMIEEAYYGVAMVNAVELLKQKTEYQTDLDFNNNGVIDFIKKRNLF